MLDDTCIARDYTPLPLEFYERKTDVVARDLLGKLVVRRVDQSVMVGRIVEAEAYFGENDPASHACRGMTPRCAIMFGRAGRAYVYLNYGVHYLLNVVTEGEGTAGAVLIRALEPLCGIERMHENRKVANLIQLTNGPGKLTKALGIDIADNGVDVTDASGNLFIASDSYEEFSIAQSKRIGISSGTEMLLRFSIEGNPFVTGAKVKKADKKAD